MLPYHPLDPDLSETVIEMTDRLPEVGNSTGFRAIMIRDVCCHKIRIPDVDYLTVSALRESTQL